MMWSKTDTLHAREVANLPAHERLSWENDELCIGCNNRLPTRIDPCSTEEEKQGEGFYTCSPCRARIKITGLEIGCLYTTLRFPVDEKRDFGICKYKTCKKPAMLADERWFGNAARARAELAGTTVAHLRTRNYCDTCSVRAYDRSVPKEKTEKKASTTRKINIDSQWHKKTSAGLCGQPLCQNQHEPGRSRCADHLKENGSQAKKYADKKNAA